MKILFVCNANIGRSQVGEAIFNHFAKRHKATSAGLFGGEHAHRTIREIAPDRVKSLHEIGIDISEKRPKQLTSEIAKESDIIIWMAPEKPIPEFVDKKKVRIWDVEDVKGKPYDFQIKNRNQIKQLVQELISELG